MTLGKMNRLSLSLPGRRGALSYSQGCLAFGRYEYGLLPWLYRGKLMTDGAEPQKVM